MSSMLWLVASALAKGPPVKPGTEPEPEPVPAVLEQVRDQGVTLSLKGLGEIWEAPEIVQVYKANSLLYGAGVVIPLHRYALLDFEVAYQRVKGTESLREEVGDADTESSFQLVPMSLLLEGRLPLGGSASLFFGAGPSLAVWKEEFSALPEDIGELTAGTTTVSGTKVSADVRGGLRFDTGIQPAPNSDARFGGVSVELALGRRIQKEPEVGLDLAAWRGSVGLGVRFK